MADQKTNGTGNPTAESAGAPPFDKEPLVREIGHADQALLERFFTENDRPEITACFHPFPLDAASAARIAGAPRRDRYFAAFSHQAIVAMGMLRGWDEGFAVPSYGILVDYRSQGGGHGRQVTEYALALARELGCPRVRLTVHPSNQRAIRLYEKLGFRQNGVTPAGYQIMVAILDE